MTTPVFSQIMLYISAENELSNDAKASVDEIRASAPLDGMSLYILLDRKREERPDRQQHTVVYRLAPGTTQQQFDAAEWDLGLNKDMADPRSLRAHLKAAQAHFQNPSGVSPRQKLLFFWGHGGGQVMLDEEQGDDTETAQANIRDFANVLSSAAESPDRPIKFDIIAFDACYMAMIETMYELRSATRLVLCSSTRVSSKSYPYENIFNALKALGPDSDAVKAADMISRSYDERFDGSPPPGKRFLFICDMTGINTAMESLNALGEKLAGLMQPGTTGEAVRAAIRNKRSRFHDSELSDGMGNYAFVHKIIEYLPGILSGVLQDQAQRELNDLLGQLQSAVDAAFAKTTTRPRSSSVSPLVWAPLDTNEYLKKKAIYHKLSGSQNGGGGWAKFWGTYYLPELQT